MKGGWIVELREWKAFERELFKLVMIAYQTVDNHLVSVLILKDCVVGLTTLTYPQVRKEVGILECIPYVFANTDQYQFYVL